MMRRLGGLLGPAHGLFAAVEGNARVLVVTEGVSAIAFHWYTTYLPLYMVALGVSEMQVGLLASVLIATQFISTLLGGYAADRFGRKRVAVVADIVCWGAPMLLYAIAQNPWYFLVGRLINGFVYIVMPSFECLLVEDVPAERRPAVFGMLRFVYAAANLFVPVAGLLVAGLGMVGAGRVIMATTMVVAVATAVYRQFTLHETQMGQARMAAVAGASPVAAARDYLSAVRAIVADRPTATFLGVRVLVGFVTTIWNTYAVIYLTDALGVGLPKAAVSLLPFVSAAATMAMIVLAANRIRRGSPAANLVIGQLLWLAAALCFVASPAGTLVLALLWALMAAVSSAFFQPASQSYWANVVDERKRAQIYSAAAAAIALGALPAGPLAGALYAANPRAPFVLGIGVQVIVLGVILALRRQTGPVGDRPEQ
jgi:MFS family permease